MIVVWPDLCLDIDLPTDRDWGLVHRNVGGEGAQHVVGDECCWCSPVCVQANEHTQEELMKFYNTSIN
jgi:hypothetical protein